MNILNSIKMILSIVLLLYFTPIFAESVSVDVPQQSDNGSKSQAGSSATPQAGSSATPQAGSSATPQAGSSATPQAGGSATPQAGGSATPQAGGSSTPQAGGSSTSQASQANSSEKKSTSQQENNCTSTDSSITASIKTNIATNEMVSSANIDVITESGVVKLIGSVNSDKEANILVEIAAAAEGVKDVDVTKLTIKGNQKLPEDSAITSKVKGAIIREKLFDNKDIIKPIEAKTTNGIVVLTGTVDNQAQVDKVVKLTQSIKGVNKVKSEIVVIEENNKK